MVQSPFESLRSRLGKRALSIVLVFTVVLTSIYGYNYVQPYIGVPNRPEDFSIIFRYGVGAHNVLDTSKGTYTKDMIVGDDITINFKLSSYELDVIWALICQNDFFELDEQVDGPWITARSHYPTYTLTVNARGYPDKQLTMKGCDFNHSDSERSFIKIVGKIVTMIEGKRAIKSLPEPRGGYA